MHANVQLLQNITYTHIIIHVAQSSVVVNLLGVKGSDQLLVIVRQNKEKNNNLGKIDFVTKQIKVKLC